MRSSDGLALAAMSEDASSGAGAGSGGQWALYDTQTGGWGCCPEPQMHSACAVLPSPGVRGLPTCCRVAMCCRASQRCPLLRFLAGRLALEAPPAFLTPEMLPVEVPSPDAGSATPRGGQQEPPPPLVWVGCAPPASLPGSGARSAGGGGKGGGSPSGVGKGVVTKSPASATKGGGMGRRKGRGGKEGGDGGALSKGEARRATPVLV